MCNLYRMRGNADEISRLFRADNFAGNIPSFDGIYPDQEAPVIRATPAGRAIQNIKWGWPGFGQVKRPITNVRNLESRMWKSALENPERRCIVPVTSFCEYSQTEKDERGHKKKIWFELRDEPLFAFAGIWRPVEGETDRYAFLTTDANEIVGNVHPKAMPVILTSDDADRWLEADWEDARKLVRPFADSGMRIEN